MPSRCAVEPGTGSGDEAGMDMRKLKYFLAVVDHGGFNRAAEHLLIAQPSLSQTIAGLENWVTASATPTAGSFTAAAGPWR